MTYNALGLEADLDGCLVETKEAGILKIVGGTLEQLGKSASVEDILKFWFETGREKIVEKIFGLNPDAFWEVFITKNTVDNRRPYTHPYKDITALKEFHSAGLKIGVVTGSPDHIAEFELELIEQALKGDYIDTLVVASFYSSIPSKPHPKSLQVCLERLQVPKERTIMVGNGSEDILAAQAAGLTDVMIDRGEYIFNGVQPTHRIKGLYELIKFVES